MNLKHICFLIAIVCSEGGARAESLWIEAEDLRPIKGYYFPADPKQKTEGAWALSGPGVAAEWTQGGESGFLSIAAHPSDGTAAISLDVDIPSDGSYAVWARYGDWREKTEPFSITVEQAGRPAWTGTYGQNPMLDEDNEMKLYWGWAFVWDQRTADLKKGPAKLTLKALPGATGPRQLDVIALTSDKGYRPRVKDRPADPAWKILDGYRARIPELESLARRTASFETPTSWKLRTFNDKGFIYFWNVGSHTPALETWLSTKPERVTVPYNIIDADVRAEFEKTYAGRKDVPIFGDDRVTPAFHGVGPSIFKTDPQTGEVTEEGKAFAQWLDANPARHFAGMMNYHPGKPIGPKGIELFNKYKARYAGSIAGEGLGYFEDKFKPEEMAAATANAKTRRQLADGISTIAPKANLAKYEAVMPGYFKTTEEAYRDVISCLSVGNITFGPLAADWGARTLGYESYAATSSVLGMRWAFMRGLGRQRERILATYRSCNFGDSATMFSNGSSFHTPQNIVDNYYSVYSGAGMTWYKFDIWYQYMAGSSIFYHEQGFDEFWIPGGTQFGKLGLQLSPKGQLVERFLRTTKENFDRGEPFTPVAFLVDYAHGWEPSCYWPNAFKNYHTHADRFLRDDHDAMMGAYLWAAFHPIGPESEKPISGTNEVFVPGVFGDIFDVVTAYPDVKKWTTIDTYPVVIATGELDLTEAEGQRLAKYVEDGGTLLVAEGQVIGPGIKALNLPAAKDFKEADGYRWLKDESLQPSGRFRYRPVEAAGGRVLAASAEGDAFCVAQERGKGRLIYLSVPRGMTIGRQAHPTVARLMAHLSRGLMPIEVEGGVEWLVNKNPTGWMVTLLNPAGQDKPQQGITPADQRQTKAVTIKCKVPVKSAVDKLLPSEKLEVKDRQIALDVPAGGVRVIELK